MEKILNRREIANGVFFTSISDARYKKNCIQVTFCTELSEDKATENALVSALLTKSSGNYPTFKELQNRLSMLYSSSLSGFVSGVSDIQGIGFNAFSLDDKYALNGEKITSDMTDILIDCIMNPVVSDGEFSAKNVETEKITVIDNIEAILNDKRSYVLNKAYEVLCKGEPAAVTAAGTVERAKKLDGKDAFKAYKNLINHSRCEIICVGCNDFTEVGKKFENAFADIDREDIEEISFTKSFIKEQCEQVVEKLKVNQSKMVIGFKTGSDDQAALVMLQKIYGGTTSSKLFMNVREKMSLCYYCSARYNDIKGIITVDCGIENQNIDKSRVEIINQLNEIKDGNITDEEIQNARMSVLNDYNSIGDNAGSVAGWYMDHIIKNHVETPQQAIERYIAVEKERIIEAAKSLVLDTIYVLTSDDSEEKEAE